MINYGDLINDYDHYNGDDRADKMTLMVMIMMMT